jgi:hypothetical protein
MDAEQVAAWCLRLGDLYAMHAAELTDLAKRFERQAETLWKQAGRIDGGANLSTGSDDAMATE